MFLKFISATSLVAILISIHNPILSRHALRAGTGLASLMARLIYEPWISHTSAIVAKKLEF
jgi:hypothetical protein